LWSLYDHNVDRTGGGSGISTFWSLAQNVENRRRAAGRSTFCGVWTQNVERTGRDRQISTLCAPRHPEPCPSMPPFTTRHAPPTRTEQRATD
jgi:hypothetical protein